MRLNKFLAQAGVGSRRSADELIRRGEVRVNGKVVKEMGVDVSPETDVIETGGKKLTVTNNIVTYLLNKPRGVISTAHDPQHRPTVLDYIPKEPRVFPCGRLDDQTQGLIVLTNDGNLCYQLTHPKFEHQKEYFVEGLTKDPASCARKLESPIILKDGLVKVDGLNIVKRSGNKINLFITIHDGRNRIVRRICGACGIEVKSLTRTKFGHYELGDLAPGKWKKA